MKHAAPVLPVVLFMALAGGPVLAGDAAPCASPAEVARVREAYAAGPPATPFMAAGKLGLPESVVASALPPDQAVGVGGGEFTRVWASLQEWPDAMTLLVKGGSILEVRAPIPPGKPSERSAYFNLDNHGAGGGQPSPLGGHLRADLFSAIYAIELPEGKPPVRGIIFLDGKGEGVFGIYVPSEEGASNPATVAAFRKTRDLLRSLPRYCR